MVKKCIYATYAKLDESNRYVVYADNSEGEGVLLTVYDGGIITHIENRGKLYSIANFDSEFGYHEWATLHLTPLWDDVNLRYVTFIEEFHKGILI